MEHEETNRCIIILHKYSVHYCFKKKKKILKNKTKFPKKIAFPTYLFIFVSLDFG